MKLKKGSLSIVIIFLCTITFGQLTVNIGGQKWMLENLNTSYFRNGDPIPEAKTNDEWVKAGNEGKPAWCYYNNDPANGGIYGKLYNWYAVNDSRGLAPSGWHIVSDQEWDQLILSLGGDQIATSKLKSKDYWANDNLGSNSSGLSIRPTGLRYDNGAFGYLQVYGVYWSGTPKDVTNAFYRYVDFPKGKVSKMAHGKNHGFAVRCIQDQNYQKEQGVVVTNNTSEPKYSGQLVKSSAGYNGQGEISYPNGFKYKGGVVNSKPDGKACEITTAKGSLFQGNFVLNGNKISGNGKVYIGDGNGGYTTNTYYEGLFIENPVESETGGKFIEGTKTTVNGDARVTAFIKNVNDIERWKLEFTIGNNIVEVNIPTGNIDTIIGTYTAVYYSNQSKLLEWNIEALKNKKPQVQYIKDKNGVIYYCGLSFADYPLTSARALGFQDIKGPFKRATDGKLFYLDGEANLTENQVSESSGLLSKEEFIQAVTKNQDKAYSCDCCNKSIIGYKKGITSEGQEWSDFMIEYNVDANPGLVYLSSYKMVTSSPHLFKNHDLSPISFMQANYPYCSKYCQKICKSK
jgi:uncharacterized protein (TIGR02145 family)